jgi:hypothetical protein
MKASILRAGLFLLSSILFAVEPAEGQRGQAATQGSASARSIAPFDITGYWVTLITEDWRARMITPPRGDFLGVPLNAAGVKLGNAWDPKADINSGGQCKSYGAAAIMRMPTRLHVTWQDDNTLKFDFDYGQQTRIVYFDKSRPRGERSWQGHAVAEWIDLRPQARPGQSSGPAAQRPRIGALQVVTTNLRPQYHRQNGSPVSENAVVTEIFDFVEGPVGEDWLIVKTIVEDSTYLRTTMVTSSHFRREPDGSKWNPTPCEVELPPVPRIAPPK